MRLRPIALLSFLGLPGLVLAAHTAMAQGMIPGQAAPPLPTIDLTRPGSARIAPRPAAAAPQVAVQPAAATPPRATKAVPAKVKPAAVAKTIPGKKTTSKAPPKAAKAKRPAKPNQTAIAGDR